MVSPNNLMVRKAVCVSELVHARICVCILSGEGGQGEREDEGVNVSESAVSHFCHFFPSIFLLLLSARRCSLAGGVMVIVGVEKA